MACDVLKILLEVLDSSVVLSSYGKQITRALLHPNVPVKEVILQEVCDSIKYFKIMYSCLQLSSLLKCAYVNSTN